MRLSPAGREQAIASLDESMNGGRELDVLIIGGGITGAGAALDARTRNLTTGIIEARDWGSGTSSRSSKLVHGGIRYLEQLNFSLVHEALAERGRLMNQLAPHLVRPVRILYPLKTRVFERFYVGAGMLLYDLFSRAGGVRPWTQFHRHFTRYDVERIAPGLKPGAFTGGLGYVDGQVDDARLVIAVVMTAVERGALAANRVRAEGFLRDGERVVGVRCRDLETGREFNVRARHVINATGVWTDDVLEYAGSGMRPTVRASKGVHIVVDRSRFQSNAGLLLRTPTSVLFVLPWEHQWIIGTTDTDWNLDKAHPAATASDIEQILGTVNQVLREPIHVDDIRGVYAGLRPLLTGESENTSQLSREHAVFDVVPGLTTIVGGKLTTYRVMAKDVMDRVAEQLGAGPSRSDTAVLAGGEGFATYRRRVLNRRHERHTHETLTRLLGRYGTRTAELLTMMEKEPHLADELPGTHGILEAEVAYAVRYEGALHLDDVLVRRTHASFESVDRGMSAAPRAATVMGSLLRWDEERTRLEVSRYVDRVSAELASQQEYTDEAADRVRNMRP